MAAAAVSHPVVNLNTQATFPIRLGSSISKPAESKKFASVRYNHKPRLDGGKGAECKISLGENDESRLDVKDGEKRYAFEGKNTSQDDRYVLLTQRNGKDTTMVLEKLQACHDFNLVRTSEEKSQDALAKRYPHLPEENEAEDDLFGDGDGEADDKPDRKNPFDFRNYLKASTTKSREPVAEAPRSGASTPQVQTKAASTTPHARPSRRSDGPLLAQRKRKAQESTKANPKRVKAGTEPPPPEPMAAPVHKNIPKVRMDRKASLHVALPDSSGELILENETPVQEKPRSAMALALAGQLGRGPISLHSAASSPASRAASPALRRPEHVEEGEDFELGGDSSPETRRRPTSRAHAEDEDVDADADADVEDLELPSPVRTHHQPQRREEEDVEEKPGGDDEDDLDKQLALAMAEEDEGDAQPPPMATEDEESEEE